jgi:hypothetical protein
MEVYNDSPTLSRLEANDIFIASNTENVVTDGPFTTPFAPYDANMLLVVKSKTGCIDKVMFVPNLSILPVKLVYFQGNNNNSKTNLQWNIAQNESSDHFEIEKSYDGKIFTKIGSVLSSSKAGSETYSFAETTVDEEKIFYRLKMVDKNQTVQYSRILSFQLRAISEKNLMVINNPVSDKLTISFQSLADEKIDVKVYDITGRIRIAQPINAYKGSNLISLPLNSGFTTGTYILDVTRGSEHYGAKFIRQ